MPETKSVTESGALSFGLSIVSAPTKYGGFAVNLKAAKRSVDGNKPLVLADVVIE